MFFRLNMCLVGLWLLKLLCHLRFTLLNSLSLPLMSRPHTSSSSSSSHCVEGREEPRTPLMMADEAFPATAVSTHRRAFYKIRPSISTSWIYTAKGYKKFLDSNPQQWGAQKHKEKTSKTEREKRRQSFVLFLRPCIVFKHLQSIASFLCLETSSDLEYLSPISQTRDSTLDNESRAK